MRILLWFAAAACHHHLKCTQYDSVKMTKRWHVPHTPRISNLRTLIAEIFTYKIVAADPKFPSLLPRYITLRAALLRTLTPHAAPPAVRASVPSIPCMPQTVGYACVHTYLPRALCENKYVTPASSPLPLDPPPLSVLPCIVCTRTSAVPHNKPAPPGPCSGMWCPIQQGVRLQCMK